MSGRQIEQLVDELIGPLALVFILLVFAGLQGHLSTFSLAHTESLWPFSLLVSSVSGAWLEASLYSCGLKYDRVSSLCGPAYFKRHYVGQSARLRAQQLRRNDVDSRAQIRADPASIMGTIASF